MKWIFWKTCLRASLADVSKGAGAADITATRVITGGRVTRMRMTGGRRGVPQLRR